MDPCRSSLLDILFDITSNMSESGDENDGQLHCNAYI